MNRQTILDKVYTKTYYVGEMLKNKDTDMKFVQACSDDSDILSDYMDAEINRINGYMTKRLVSFSIDKENITVNTNRPLKDKIVNIIENALESYLVEYITWKWIKDNYPQIANPSDKEERLWQLKDAITSLSPSVRRRATTIGI
jgi:hypothetical protein